MVERSALLDRFVASTRWKDAVRAPLAGDASARRYQRWHLPETGETCVLMDAPPDANGPVTPFVRIAQYLGDAGFSAPKILAEDTANGFLLIEDLGDGVFARLIQQDSRVEDKLYDAAVDVLIALDKVAPPSGIPQFTPSVMTEQASLVLETYGDRQEDILAFRAVFETILTDHLPQRQVLILRDFHAENLIWLPERTGLHQVGLLDFQDAMAGPVGYDLISLIHDARRDVPSDLANRLTRRFVAELGLNAQEFEATRAVLCAQRNLRILAVFARLAKSLGKTGYVDLIPRVWDHLEGAMTHPAMAPLRPVFIKLPKPSSALLDRLRHPCR